MKTTTFLAASAIVAGAFVDIAYGAPFPSIPNPDATDIPAAKVFEVDFDDGRAPVYLKDEKRYVASDIDEPPAPIATEEPTVILDHYLDPESAAKLAPEIFNSPTPTDVSTVVIPRYLDPEFAAKLAPEIFQSSTSKDESAVVAPRSPAMGPIDEGLARELLFRDHISGPLYKAIACEMIRSPLSILPSLQQQATPEFCKRSDVDAIREMDVATSNIETLDNIEKSGEVEREEEIEKYLAEHDNMEKTIGARTPLDPWGRPTTKSPVNQIVEGYKQHVAKQLAWQQNQHGRIHHHVHGPSSRSIEDEEGVEQQLDESLSARMIPSAAKEVGVDSTPAESLTTRDMPPAAKETKAVKTPKVEKPETAGEVQAKASFNNFMNVWQETLTFLQDVTSASESFVDKIDSESDVENFFNATSSTSATPAVKAPAHVVDTDAEVRRSSDEPYQHIDPAVLFWWEGQDFSYVDTLNPNMEVVERFFSWLNNHQDRFPKPSEVPTDIVDIAEVQKLMTDEQKYFFWKWVHEQEGQMSTTPEEKAQWAKTSPTNDDNLDDTKEALTDRWRKFKKGLRDAKDRKSKLYSRDFIGPVNPMPYETPASDATDATRMGPVDQKMQAQPWYHNPQWQPSPKETEDESSNDEDAASSWWGRSITEPTFPEQTPTEQPPTEPTESPLPYWDDWLDNSNHWLWIKTGAVESRHEERDQALMRRFDVKNEYNDEFEYVPLSPAQQEEESDKTLRALKESLRYPTQFSRLMHGIVVNSQRILNDLKAATSSPVEAENEENISQEEFDNADENYKHGQRKRGGEDEHDPLTDAGFNKFWEHKTDELWDEISDITNHYPDGTNPFGEQGCTPKPSRKGHSKRGDVVDECEQDGSEEESDIVKRQYCIHRDGAFPKRLSPAETKDIHNQFSKFKWPKKNNRSWAPESDKDQDISEEERASMPVVDGEMRPAKQEKRDTPRPRPSNGHIEGDDDLRWSERFDTASPVDDARQRFGRSFMLHEGLESLTSPSSSPSITRRSSLPLSDNNRNYFDIWLDNWILDHPNWIGNTVYLIGHMLGYHPSEEHPLPNHPVIEEMPKQFADIKKAFDEMTEGQTEQFQAFFMALVEKGLVLEDLEKQLPAGETFAYNMDHIISWMKAGIRQETINGTFADSSNPNTTTTTTTTTTYPPHLTLLRKRKKSKTSAAAAAAGKSTKSTTSAAPAAPAAEDDDPFGLAKYSSSSSDDVDEKQQQPAQPHFPPHLVIFWSFEWLCKEIYETLQAMMVNPYSEAKIEQRVQEKLDEIKAAKEDIKKQEWIAKGKEMDDLEKALKKIESKGYTGAADVRQILLEKGRQMGRLMGQRMAAEASKKGNESQDADEEEEYKKMKKKRGIATTEQSDVVSRDLKADRERFEKQFKDDWAMLQQVMSVIKDALTPPVQKGESGPEPLTGEELGEEYAKDDNSKTWEGA